jgi:hypothetical protein
MRGALVPTIHVMLAATVATIAIIGMFGTGARADDSGVRVVGGFGWAFFIVLPLSGIVALGTFDWQIGRGSTVLRVADVAVFVLAMLELSLGTIGLARWLAGAMALLAAGGLAASFLVAPPRRAGWRR